MENATKALTMAGGILIAMLVVSLVTFGITRLNSYQETKDSSKKVEQITEYNKRFETYNKKVIKGYEIVSLANLVENTNNQYGDTIYRYTPLKAYISFKTKGIREYGTFESYVDTVKKYVSNPAKVSSELESNKDYKEIKKDSDTSNFYDLEQINSTIGKEDTDNKNKEYQRKKDWNDLKSRYFQCDGMIYDQNTGYVIGMFFEEILRNN